MTRSRSLVLILGLVLAVAGCGSPPVAGGGGGGGGSADGGGNGKGGGTNSDGGSGGGTTDGGSGGGTTDGGSGGGTTDGGSGGGTTDGGSGGVTDGGSGGTTDGGSGGVTDGGTTDGGSGGTVDGGTPDGGTGGIAGHHIKTVFMIVMENKNWDDIKGKSSAPYINDTLLADGVHAEDYHSAPGVHPSEPNYIWLEAGTNFGISNDNDPSSNVQNTTAHLVTLLDAAGVTWRSYQEDIDGTTCPLTGHGLYAPKHDPMLFFDDSTGNLDKHDAYCMAHNVPYTQLATDLQNNTVAQYNFITPNLCDDMHNDCTSNPKPVVPNGDYQVKQGDDWLSHEVPKILASQAYQDGGLLIITWDESEFSFSCLGANCPIGFIILSPYAKAPGYSNNIKYDHSSTLKTIEEIFDVHPLLGHAADSGTQDLSDFFTQFP